MSDELRIHCRRFGSIDQAKRAYQRLERLLRLQADDPAASSPDVSAALSIDADSAAAFVLVYGPDADAHVDELGGQELDPSMLPAEYIQGLAARRRQATAGQRSGERVDLDRPSVLRADGRTRPF